MGSAQRNMFPDGVGYAPESSGNSTTIQSYNGIKAIQVHLDHIARLKGYLCAETKEIPDIPLTCYSECQTAKWSYSENVKECANRKLIYCVTLAGPIWHTVRGLIRDGDPRWLWHVPASLGSVVGDAWGCGLTSGAARTSS